MLDDALNAFWVVMAFLGVAGFIGRVITAVQERRATERRRREDRERIIAQQDRIIEERRRERALAQQNPDSAETHNR